MNNNYINTAEEWGIGPELLVEEKYLHQFIDEISSKYPDKKAIIEVDEFSDSQTYITYSELKAKSVLLARKLIRDGVSEGCKIAVIMGRTIDIAITTLAISRCGAICVPLDRDIPEERFIHIWNDSICSWQLICEPSAII